MQSNMTMQDQEMVIRNNSDTEAALKFIDGQLNQLLSTGSHLDQPVTQGLNHPAKQVPDNLDIRVLMHLLFSFQQPGIRRFILRNIRKTLQKTAKNLSGEIHAGPLFYPFSPHVPEKKGTIKSIKASDLEQLCRISDALLLFQAYTEDTEYLTSGGFDVQLVLSRLWTAMLNNPGYWEKLDNAGNISVKLQETAAQVLTMTLNNITYLKADHSWMYEDYRENYQFSEIKETALWKKIIKHAPGNQSESPWNALVIKNGIQLKDASAFSEFIKSATARFKPGTPGNSNDTSLEVMAATRNTILQFCLGFSISNRKPSFRPVLPADWESYRIPLHIRNTLVEFCADKQNLILRNLSSVQLDMELNGLDASIPGFDEILLAGSNQDGMTRFLLPGK